MSINERRPSDDEIRTTAYNPYQLADDLLSTLGPDYPCSVNPEVTLREWSLVHKEGACLHGITKNHPHIEDGLATTSLIFFIDPMAGLARSYSRWYRLVGPAPTTDIIN